jgi:predicted RNA-binding Zn-ribbon protein involved in translation (DUF1610 family)
MTEYLKFKCSNCGWDELEEVCEDVVLAHTIQFAKDPDEFNEYGPEEILDARVSHYQCAKCGNVLMGPHNHPINDEQTLRDYLLGLDCNREPENG